MPYSTRHTPLFLRVALAAALSVPALWGCRGPSEPTPGAPAEAPATAAPAAPDDGLPPMTVAPVRFLKRSELTPAEILYGRGPRPDPSITYTPEVMIVEGGANAIRSLSPDGLFWTIDPDAPGADRLRVGRIAFVTGRCVGRVLAAHRTAAGLTLLLAPVDLLDIYERLEIRVENQPLDFAEFVESPAPRLPEWISPSREQVDPFTGWNIDTASGTPGFQPISTQMVSPGIPNPIGVGLHTVDALIKAAGPGMTLDADDQGTRLRAQVQFHAVNPTFEFTLRIYKSKLYVHAMLHNVAKMRLAFDAAVSDQFFHNHVWKADGGGLTIPLTGPAGFNLDIRQHFEVTTAFSASTSSFGAGGTYRLHGGFGLSYSPTGWIVHHPKGLTIESPLMSTMTGVSFGPRGMILRHDLTITGGLGAAGFTVGPQFILHTVLAVAQGATPGIVQCREASLGMHARATVGYTIPRPVVSFVNFFLKLVNVPPMKDTDGLPTAWHQLFEPIRVRPGGQSCVAAAAPRPGPG